MLELGKWQKKGTRFNIYSMATSFKFMATSAKMPPFHHGTRGLGMGLSELTNASAGSGSANSLDSWEAPSMDGQDTMTPGPIRASEPIFPDDSQIPRHIFEDKVCFGPNNMLRRITENVDVTILGNA